MRFTTVDFIPTSGHVSFLASILTWSRMLLSFQLGYLALAKAKTKNTNQRRRQQQQQQQQEDRK